MIKFDNWRILNQGKVLARQYDNLTRELRVEGIIPEGWTWDLLVQAGKNLDIIRLNQGENSLSVMLTSEMLALAGYYVLQLRATQGEKVRHTNVTRVYIPESLSGDGQWPEVPSEFTQLEQAVQQSAQQAAQAAESAQKAQQAIEGMTVSAKTLEPESKATVEKTVRDDVVNIEIGVPAGKPGDPGKAGENGGYYAPAVSEDGELSWTASRLDMPAVPSVNIHGPAGKDAPQINDDTVSATNPWSSRKIVDTLAPTFESSGPVVTCNPVDGYPLHVVSQIVPVQEGEGDPSPDNVRPISGWAQATLTHNDTPITLSFGQTVYGGTLDWTTGVLTVTWKEADLSYPFFYPTGGNGIRFNNALDGVYSGGEGLCNYGKIGTSFTSGTVLLGTSPGVSSVYFIGLLDLLGLSSVEEYIRWAQTNKIIVIYKTQNPFTVKLTPQEVIALSGTNIIYTDTGDTTVSGRADPNTIIQQLATRIAALEGAATNL